MLNGEVLNENILVGEIQREIIDLRKEEQHKTVKPTSHDILVEPDTPMQTLGSVLVKGVALDKPDQDKSVMPSVEEQVIRADDGYELASVTVGGVTSEIDGNIQAENIRYGVEILGVVGAMEQKEDLDAELTEQDAMLDALEQKVNVLPVKENIDEDLTAQESLISEIQNELDNIPEVERVPVEAATATESDVLAGKTFFSGNNELKTGTLTIGTKIVEIELPQEFYDAHSLYYYAVNQDTVLISTGNYIGIWVCHIKAKTIERKWSGGSSWQNFYQITDDLVIITSSMSPNSTLVYDAKSDTISATKMNFTGTIYIQQVSDDKFLISPSGSVTNQVGLYSLDVNSITTKKVRDTGSSYRYFTKMADCWLFGSSNTTVICRYNIADDTVDTIYTTLRWDTFNVIDNVCYISSTYSNTGILKYNHNDKTIKPIYDVGYNWRYIVKAGGKIFVSSSSSSYPGLYLIENDEVINIYETGYGYRYFYTINDRVIINNNSKTALIYDSNDGSVSSLSAPISSMKYGIALKDRVLLLSDSTGYTPLAVYYYETNEIKQHPTLMQFAYYDTLKQDGDNCYISSSKSGYGMVAYYTYADDSIKLMGAKVEV